MLRAETIELAGFASAFKALRLPFGKEERTETSFGVVVNDDKLASATRVWPNPKDVSLMQTLIRRGDEHAKVLRGIVVWMKITAPIYWWCEMETYRAGHERLCSESTMHIDCQGLSGEELQRAKAEIPMGKELTKIDFFSYQCLRNIYKQRKNHRLQEWHTFCEEIEKLPFSKELITYGLDED